MQDTTSFSLRRWRVVEAGFQIYGFAMPAPEESTGTLMSRIARERSIPSGSQMFVTGERQFRENIDLILNAYRSAGIPVFIGTLASNEKDQPPFVSAAPPPAEARAWEFNRASLLEAIDKGDAAAARQAASLLVSIAPQAADSWFLQGRVELLGRRSSEARHAFLAAKDHDQLRFRAPESFNEIIRDAAVSNGATVVDVQAFIASRSANGIIGNELMLEHLHPNVDGYFLMGDAFLRAITTAQVGGPPTRDVDEATAKREMPVTEIDRLAGGWRVERLKKDWPFQIEKQPFNLPVPETEIERIALDWFTGQASWTDTMNNALGYYSAQGNMVEASRVASLMATAFPFEPDPAFIAGRTILALGQAERALPFLHRAARLDPDNTRYLMALAQGFYVSGRIDDSIAVLNRVLAIDSAHSGARQFKEKLQTERSEAES
jgi:tetratricopeptide (TPR) repeat protein